jgi:hypothetical protein
MSPQLRSILAKVIDARYHGKNDPKYVIGALVCIASEPTFSTKLAVESIRTAKKMLFEALDGPGDFWERMKDPAKRAVAEQWSLSVSYSIRRANGKNQEPLLADIGE